MLNNSLYKKIFQVTLLRFLSNLIEDFYDYFIPTYNESKQIYEVFINLRNIRDLINETFYFMDRIEDNRIDISYNAFRIYSLEESEMNSFRCTIFIYDYYYSNRFTLQKEVTEGDVEDYKNFMKIIEKLFLLNHLMNNESIYSFNKKRTKTFIRSYLDMIKNIFLTRKSLKDNKYVVKVGINNTFYQESKITVNNEEHLKECILTLKNEFKNKYNYIENEDIQCEVRKKLEYFTNENLTNDMIADQEDWSITNYYDFLDCFRINLFENREAEEISSIIVNDSFKKTLTEVRFQITIMENEEVYYNNAESISCKNINEVVEYIQLNYSSEENKEIFLPLVGDRRLHSVKAIL